MHEQLQRLEELREQAVATKKRIIKTVESENRSHLSQAESRDLKEAAAAVTDYDEQIAQARDDIERSGRDNPAVAWVAAATSRVSDDDSRGGGWAARAAKAVEKAMGGESRAISSGSVDVPALVSPSVTPIARPARLIDLLTNRSSVSGNAFEYFRQSVRTTNAAPVADLATKPESTYSLDPIEDRCRVVAHVSEPVPIRLWQDASDVTSWLESEMRQGVLDALEGQVIGGDGTGENFTGVLNVSGTTPVAFDTDEVTTLRSALTELQKIGVEPNAWILSPDDAQTIDLTTEGTGGAFLADGYQQTNSSSANVFGPSSIQRVVSNSVPQGTAILADWSQVRLYVREGMRLDIDAGGDLFKQNAAIVRAESRAGLGHLRPASFAVVDLTGA